MGIFESIKSAFSSKAESDAADHPTGAEHGSVDDAPPAAREVPSADGDPTIVSTNGERSYTVLSGDTLWKISLEMYGDGSKYLNIFEANSGILESPDQIFPGQVLVIPDPGKDQ